MGYRESDNLRGAASWEAQVMADTSGLDALLAGPAILARPLARTVLGSHSAWLASSRTQREGRTRRCLPLPLQVESGQTRRSGGRDHFC
eukprot:scaffold141789_cov32-Tisochrysis_lutea.AAC.2